MYCEYKDFFSCQNLDRRPLSVCKIAMYLKELKNIPLNRFMDYRLRVQRLFFAIYPLYLFSVLQRNALKTRIIPNSLSYRLSENWLCL